MKIDKWDKKILTNLYKNSRATLSELSKKVGLPKENIHYRIKRFEKENIINYIPYVNLSKLGYNYFLIRLRIDPMNNKYESTINSIKNLKQVIWLSEEKIQQSKDYNINIIYIEKVLSKAEDFVDNYREKKHVLFADIKLIRVIFRGYNEIYGEDEKYDCLSKTGAYRYNEKYDYTDQRLVEALLKNSRSRLTELSKTVGISELTVKNRILSLMKRKIIDKFMIALNFDKLPGKFVMFRISKKSGEASKTIWPTLSKYFNELMIITPFFWEDRIIFGRVKDDDNLIKAFSELNKLKNFEVTSLSEKTRIVKNKIF